jgi:hemerythrin-like domain-containing protein
MNQLTEIVEKRAKKEIDRQVNEQVDATIDLMVSTVDKYLSHVADQWMTENALAVEHGIKTQITENFMSGLKNLFNENYIDLPDDKVDVVEALAEKVEKLQESLDRETDKTIELAEELVAFKRKELIREEAADLTEIEQEKFFALTEDLELLDEKSFVQKLQTIKESYFKKAGTTQRSKSDDDFLGVNVNEEDDKPAVAPSKMQIYADILSQKINPKLYAK